MHETPVTDRDSWRVRGVFEVAEGIHRIPCPLPGDGLQAVNVYAIEDRGGVALVDTGSGHPVAFDVLQSGLRELGHKLSDVTAVICTHAHYDHYGNTTRIKRASDAPVVLGRTEADILRVAVEPGAYEDWTHERALWLAAHGAKDVIEEIERADGAFQDAVVAHGGWCAPDLLMDDGGHVHLERGRLTAVLTPGHTRGHLMLRDETSGVIFAGDHVLPQITPSLGFEPRTDGRVLAAYLTSLAATRRLEATLVAPGHGPVFADLPARVDELLAHHDDRLAACIEILNGRGATSARDVAERLPWTRHLRRYAELDALNKMLAVTETLTHLELLVDRGSVRRIAGEPVHYEHVSSNDQGALT